MIRHTWYDLSTGEHDYHLVKCNNTWYEVEDCIWSTPGEYSNEYWCSINKLNDRIIKIEKPARDLTLDELNQLGARTIRDRFDHVTGVLFSEKEYSLDDYIDITSIIRKDS